MSSHSRRNHLDDEWFRIALEVCTPGQVEALVLREHGFDNPRLARLLGIRADTIRGRIKRAHERISAEMARREENAA